MKSSSDSRNRYESARILLLQSSANKNRRRWNGQQDPLRIVVRLGNIDMCYLLVCIGKMNPRTPLTRGSDGKMMLKDTTSENQWNRPALLQILRTHANGASESVGDGSVGKSPGKEHLDRSTSWHNAAGVYRLHNAANVSSSA